MVRFFRESGLPSRRVREAARQRRRSDRASDLKIESLEPRLALAVMPVLADNKPPEAVSVALPAAGTYGTGSNLTFKVRFSEPVKVVGSPADVFVPVEVGYAMRQAQYVSGSGTRSLTFRMTVTANDVDTDGISLGRVNVSAVRDFDFNRPTVTPPQVAVADLVGNAASNMIPPVNTSRIRVDATGPVVTSYAAFATKGRQVSLKVTFDGPVTVKGKPMVPVTIGGVPYNLSYVAGSKTSTLTFTVTVPKDKSVPKDKLVANPTFRGENGLPGEVIVLPKGADLKDRLGNSVTPIGGKFGQIYTDNGKPDGNRVVVIGTHYEPIRTGDRKVSVAELDEVLTKERDEFNPAEPEAYWRDYQNPDYRSALYDVDVYRVAYRTTIPEQGNRPTVAYGLVAIPQGVTGAIPMVSVQHGTLWLKESGPSQAFSWDKNSETVVKYGYREKDFYTTCYETRLNVAQFAGQGYAVIAADYVGIGNSVENDSFVVKASEQRACLDMLTASERLLAAKSLYRSQLFLNGWSQGALVSISFQEALEAAGVAISGVSTAATPANTGMFAQGFIFNRRPYSEVTVPDWPWAIFVHQFSSFALASYSGQTNAPLELFGGNYDFARTFYMREFKAFPGFSWRKNKDGDMVPVMEMDKVTRDAEVSKFLDQRVVQSPRAYESTAYAKLIEAAASGKTRLVSDMKMYYGEQDEGYAVPVCLDIDTWQRGTYGKTNIEQVPVPSASHRSTFFTAVAGQIEWFNAKRGLPNAATDLTATLINGGVGATLAWTTPATNGSPITGYRVEYKAVTDRTWTRLPAIGPVPPSATVTGLTPGQRYQYRVFAFTGNGAVGQVGLSSNVAVTGNHAPEPELPVVTARDPVTGEVIGVLTVADRDGDPLKYRVSVWPTKGSVAWTFVKVGDVVDTTRMVFTYTPTAAARKAAADSGATDADKSDSFTVTVSDGYGGIVSVPIGVVVG
ncbi:MAG: fibronectin type III domain-containing protein [Planctomycetes bacterium]|nr:fibronectin type III domain-containing protein [Planctomycetota bacterium]